MGWIVGIICVILIVIFWRVVIPLAALAALAALAFGGFLIYENYQGNKRERERVLTEQLLRHKLAAASSNAGDIERQWVVQTVRDPASGESIPRSTGILSDGNICRLQVEQRIDRTRLAGIYCPGFRIARYDNVDVKFDNRLTSDTMVLETFSDGDDVYIPSNQPTYGNHLQYDEFLRRIISAKKVAMRLKFDVAGQHWITFSLTNAGQALVAIGAVQPLPVVAPKRSMPKEAVGETSVQTRATETKPTAARRTDGDAIIVRLPKNAELDYTGSNWKCARSYRRVGNECAPVAVPAYGELDYTGSNWKCERGYARSGGECVAVHVPANGELDYTGNNWKCQRGFRRTGAGCVPVGVVSTN